jgi:ribonuclease HI
MVCLRSLCSVIPTFAEEGSDTFSAKHGRVKKVTVYTDGSCLGNPGPGGWGAILMYGRAEKEISGGDPQTTNNRMEMQAAVEALRALKEPCQVDVHSDSAYLVQGFSNGWVDKWQANGWRTSSKADVKNVDLWQDLIDLTKKHRVRFHHVKGHAGHPLNERCDKLATEAAAQIAASTALPEMLDAPEVPLRQGKAKT